MEPLPRHLYRAEQVRAMDQATIDSGVPGYALMERAAEAALAALLRHWPARKTLLVLAGAGNNAGDGYVLGRLALQQGLAVELLACVPVDRLSGDGLQAAGDFVAAGGDIQPWAGPVALAEHETVVVDALLGTGLDRAVEGNFAAAVEFANGLACPVLALDIPSGLHADTGACLGVAVEADLTVTFVALKQGLLLGDSANYCGLVEFAGLGVSPAVYAQHQASLVRLDASELVAALPPRRRASHKGNHGNLLLVGGGPGMPGAIRLAAEAALRVGAGLVRVATCPENVAAVTAGRPEVICHGVTSPGQLDGLIAASDAIVVGPGLGLSDWAQALWHAALASPKPLVIDADGLNLLAEKNPSTTGPRIITPHPGEAARLLRWDNPQVQANRLESVKKLAEDFDAIAILKGARTLIAGPGVMPPAVCDRGNPGMASAGMGDVLTGVIGGLLVQFKDPALAARVGVLLHAVAGDAAAASGERGTLACDLMPHLRQWANP
jgi:hydroxyethylthiazole kinase-like uncharacterized protein yjeF